MKIRSPKISFATEEVYHDIKYEKTVGIIEENLEEGYMKVAEPIGIIAGVTPVTNPTSTTMFKSLISVKTRNPIIFSFHPEGDQVQYCRCQNNARCSGSCRCSEELHRLD